MKDLKILALVTMLALGFTLSAQAQSQNTTGSDHIHDSDYRSDYFEPRHAGQRYVHAAEHYVEHKRVHQHRSSNNSDFATTVRLSVDKREPQSEIDYLQRIQNDSGAN